MCSPAAWLWGCKAVMLQANSGSRSAARLWCFRLILVCVQLQGCDASGKLWFPFSCETVVLLADPGSRPVAGLRCFRRTLVPVRLRGSGVAGLWGFRRTLVPVSPSNTNQYCALFHQRAKIKLEIHRDGKQRKTKQTAQWRNWFQNAYGLSCDGTFHNHNYQYPHCLSCTEVRPVIRERMTVIWNDELPRCSQHSPLVSNTIIY